MLTRLPRAVHTDISTFTCLHTQLRCCASNWREPSSHCCLLGLTHVTLQPLTLHGIAPSVVTQTADLVSQLFKLAFRSCLQTNLLAYMEAQLSLDTHAANLLTNSDIVGLLVRFAHAVSSC